MKFLKQTIYVIGVLLLLSLFTPALIVVVILDSFRGYRVANAIADAKEIYQHAKDTFDEIE